MQLRAFLVVPFLFTALACGGASSTSSRTPANNPRATQGTLLTYDEPLDTAAPWAPIAAPGRSAQGLVHNHLTRLAPHLRQCATDAPVQLPLRLVADAQGRVTDFSASIQDASLIATLNCLVQQFVEHPIAQLPAESGLPSAPGAVTVDVTLVLR